LVPSNSATAWNFLHLRSEKGVRGGSRKNRRTDTQLHALLAKALQRAVKKYVVCVEVRGADPAGVWGRAAVS
jgi:hypothetical protein